MSHSVFGFTLFFKPAESETRVQWGRGAGFGRGEALCSDFSKCGRRMLPLLCNCRRQISPSLRDRGAHSATLHIPVNYNLPETWRLQQQPLPPVCREREGKKSITYTVICAIRAEASLLCFRFEIQPQLLLLLLFFLLPQSWL